METEERNYHNMVHSVIRTRGAHLDVTTPPVAPPAIVRAFDDLVGIEARLNLHRRRQEGTGLKVISGEKATLQKAMCQTTLVVAGMVHALSAANADTALLAQADSSLNELLNLPDKTCADRCATLVALITVERRPILTAEYGLTPELEQNASDLIDEFSHQIGAPRAFIIERKTAGQQVKLAITDARFLFDNRLAPLLRQYNLPARDPISQAKRAFYDVYQSARIIVDLAASHAVEKKKEA